MIDLFLSILMSVIYVVDWVKRCFKSVKVAISKYYVIIIIITLQLDLKNMLGYCFAEGLKISDNFFPPLMFNFAFLNKIVEIKFSKYNCPKSLLCRHRRCVYPIHVSLHQIVYVTYLSTENYMIYFAFLQQPE